MLIPLLLATFLLPMSILSQKCSSDAGCNDIWPDATCSRSKCRCPRDTVRKKSSSRDFVCISLVDVATGEAGPPLTCPLPEGAGYQLAYRSNNSPVFCSSKNDDCPPDYECIQGLGISPFPGKDGVCCPDRAATCAHPIFDHDDGTLLRFGFDGKDCVSFLWNPNRASTANVFRTREHCLSYCVNNSLYSLFVFKALLGYATGFKVFKEMFFLI